jgi:UDP-GlcNAc:undecaprenyl-phosphate GlcNAc-1-phosphate transferase
VIAASPVVTVLVLAALSALLSVLLTPVVRELARRARLTDAPGARKLHLLPVPRLGGVGVAVAIGATLAVAPLAGVSLPDPAVSWPLLAGALLVFAIGLADDLRPLSPGTKLLAQAAAALVVVISGIRIERVTVLDSVHELPAAGAIVTVVWIVVVTNAFNLIDGLDGLAAGLAAIAATTCAAALLARGLTREGLVLGTLAGALVGFLPYNFNPATVFLGDSGSLLCGFLLAVTAITGWQKGVTALSVAEALLIFALPLVDTAWSVIRRTFARLDAAGPPPLPRLRRLHRIVEADRAHIHHRLLALGLSHRLTVLALYGIAAGLSILALLSIEP